MSEHEEHDGTTSGDCKLGITTNNNETTPTRDPGLVLGSTAFILGALLGHAQDGSMW